MSSCFQEWRWVEAWCSLFHLFIIDPIGQKRCHFERFGSHNHINANKSLEKNFYPIPWCITRVWMGGTPCKNSWKSTKICAKFGLDCIPFRSINNSIHCFWMFSTLWNIYPHGVTNHGNYDSQCDMFCDKWSEQIAEQTFLRHKITTYSTFCKEQSVVF